MRNGIISPLPGKIKPSQRSRRMIGDFICEVVFTRSEANRKIKRSPIDSCFEWRQRKTKRVWSRRVVNIFRTTFEVHNTLARIVISTSTTFHKVRRNVKSSNIYCCDLHLTIVMRGMHFVFFMIFFQLALLKHSNCIVWFHDTVDERATPP